MQCYEKPYKHTSDTYHPIQQISIMMSNYKMNAPVQTQLQNKQPS